MADELSLGTIINYQGNANNALGSGNYGNAELLDINPQTQAAVNSFSNFIQKKRDDGYKEYHDNVIKAIAEVKNTDGVMPEDSEKINKAKIELLKHIGSNPEAFTTKSILSQNSVAQDMESKTGDYASMVATSQATKKALDVFDKQISANSDLNNDVNRKLYQKVRSAEPEERVKLIDQLTPVSDGDKDLQSFENVFYKNVPDKTIRIIDNPKDAGSYDRVVTGHFDRNSYLQGFKSAKGLYLAKQFELDPQLQEKYKNDVDAYIEDEADLRFQEHLDVEKITKGKDEEYYQNRLDTREANKIASSEKIAYARIAQQKESASQRATKVPELNTLNDKFDDLNKIMDENAVEKDFFGAKAKVSIVPSTSLNENLEKYINTQRIPIGRDENDKIIYKQATSLLRVESLDGKIIKYLPAYQGEETKSEFVTDKQSPLTESAIKARMADAKEMKALDEYNSSHKSPMQPTSQSQKSTFKYENINGYVDEFKGLGIGIGSTVRTESENKKAGGVPDSLHMKNLAVDIPQSKNGGREGLRKLIKTLRGKFPELDIVDEIDSKNHIHIEMDGKKAGYLPKSNTAEPKPKKIVKGVSGIKWK